MDRYQGLLRNQGMSSAELERNVQRDMLGSVLREGINASAFVTDHEITQVAALENQTREFDELRVSVSAFRDRVSVSEDEVASYYESNQDEFMTEPTADLAYIELSMDDIRESVEVSEDDLRSAWEEEREQYLADEERLARHILIPVEEDENEDAALEEAREVRSKLDEGAEFGELAEEYSADTMSAEEGGSLGWVLQGDMVGPVDEAIFSLDAGEVSDPVRSEFGYHVIRVDEVETPEPLPFEEARDELLTELKTRKAEQRYFDLREELADETFSNPDSLIPIADRLGLEVRSVEDVTPDSGSGVASSADVRRAAFSPEVRDERLNSDPIELDEESVVVIRVNEYEPATPRPQESVAEDIRDTLLDRKAADQAVELGEELLSGLQEGTGAEALAERDGVDLQAGRSAGRQEQELDRALRRALFRMPRPGDAGASHEMVERSDGDVAVLVLRSVTSGATELAEEERERRRNGMQRTRAEVEFNAFVRELRRRMDVELVGREELDSEPQQGSPQPAPGI